VKNTLTLKTERLNELTTDDLHAVGGAAAPSGIPCMIVIGQIPTLRGCTTAIICP
jgi:hypothetical protein